MSELAVNEGSLESLPEIERENILAGRLEEMQKFKDSQALDAMYKMAGMGDDEEDDEPKKRRRSYPTHQPRQRDATVLTRRRQAH